MNSDYRIEVLKELINSEGWNILKEELNQEIERAENEILAQRGLDHELNKIQYSGYDLLRQERLIYKELIGLPESLIDRNSPVEEQEIDI